MPQEIDVYVTPHYRVVEKEIELDEKKKRELMKRLEKLECVA